MAVDLSSYAWLAQSAIGEAGCVTIMPGLVAGSLERAFGCLPEGEASAGGEEVLVTGSPVATTAFEDNGFQVCRPEVLGPLSRPSGNSKAASLFWNVEGMVVLALAQRGRVLCEVELLGADEDELEGIPKRLQKLLLSSPDNDLLAVGALPVETFTGVGFSAEGLARATPRSLDPVAQRALAEAVTLAAVREAGVANAGQEDQRRPSAANGRQRVSAGQPHNANDDREQPLSVPRFPWYF